MSSSRKGQAGHESSTSSTGGANERREGDRRRKDRRDTTQPTGQEIIVASSLKDERPSAKPAASDQPPPAAFAAQVLGQPGKKRGLKAGPSIRDEARTTYLSREYSGPFDRRPQPGGRKLTDI